MIALGPEPEGVLLRPADVFAWLPGLDRKEWEKIRPHLRPIPLPGGTRPYYSREEVRAKLVEPIHRALADTAPKPFPPVQPNPTQTTTK